MNCKKRLLCGLLCLLLPLGCFACERQTPQEQSTAEAEPSDEASRLPDPNAPAIWSDICADKAHQLQSASDVYALTCYRNGEEASPGAPDSEDDVRWLLHGESATRYVNHPEGYALTFPDASVRADLRLGQTRTQLLSDVGVLTVTLETENPYSDDPDGWDIFLREWLEPHLVDNEYLMANLLRNTRKQRVDTEMLPGYEVRLYSQTISLPGKNMPYPYYQIAIIRKTDVYKKCFLLVFKAPTESNALFDEIVCSFREFDACGTPVSTQGQFDLRIPENWNAETRAYYKKLCAQTGIDWGFFTRSMVHSSDESYAHQCETLTQTQDFLQSEEGVNYQPDIMPTYSELSYGDTVQRFPTEMANAYAGGNGFNGKPVLQFTYHMSEVWSSRGEVSGVFDVLRGRHDRNFRQLAQDIKAYGHPVLFRLNNEMNGDWCSYCCPHTLMDPDLFVQAWKRMYDIFAEEGVDNCIWVWNPVAVDTPYGNYNDHLHYFPGSDYVQVIGLTYYEMNNDSYFRSFKSLYTELYEKNIPYFDAFPWVLGEFGCAAGGERKMNWDTGNYDATQLGRNRLRQATWVRDMFACLNHKDAPENAFCTHIKAAVWFSVNDTVWIDDREYITNYIRLDADLPETLEQFRIGLAENLTVRS